MSNLQCPESEMKAILDQAARGDAAGLAQVEAKIARYGGDERLHFLKGSLLASLQNYSAAQEAMAQALQINPGYWIARFQLGLLQLSNGDSERARATWRPLHDFPDDHYVSTFVRGLEFMMVDDFRAATDLLRAGIAANSEIPAMNNDMRLLISEMTEKAGSTLRKAALAADPEQAEPTSATHFLLNVFKQKGRPN
jgi:tetratricopeptide (TPR) repeat protein